MKSELCSDGEMPPSLALHQAEPLPRASEDRALLWGVRTGQLGLAPRPWSGGGRWVRAVGTCGLQHRDVSLLGNQQEIKFSTWLVWVTRLCSADLFLHYFLAVN